jgi:integrase
MPRNELRLQAGILQPEHRASIRAACRDAKERAIVESLLTMRRAEVAALRWRDVDLVKGIAQIQRGKGGRADWTLLLPVTVAALTAWHTASGAPAPDAFVFPVPGSGDPARPYTPGGLGKIVQAILTRAGCWWRGLGAAHRFRRSFATEYLRENREDLVGLQRLMRHKQVSTTARYCFLQPADLAPRLSRVTL